LNIIEKIKDYRNALTIVIALAGMGIVTFYKICDTECSYLSGDILGVDLEIITENHLDRAFDLLQSGKADIIAIGLTVNSSRKRDILFTDPELPAEECRHLLYKGPLEISEMECRY